MSTNISAESLHKPQNDPSTLNITPGLEISKLQRQHVAVTLDLFQGKATMAQIIDNFTKDMIYEDPVALAKNREEFAGQLLHIPTVTSRSETLSYIIQSLTPKPTTHGLNTPISDSTLIEVQFKHDLEFKAPLPQGMKTLTLDTTLQVYSTEKGIVRLMDRPKDQVDRYSVFEWLRKLNGVIVPATVGIPRNDKEDAERAATVDRKE